MLPLAIGALVLLFVVNPLVYKTLIERYTEQKISFGKSLLSILTVSILSGVVYAIALGLFLQTGTEEEAFFFARLIQIVAVYFIFAKIELKKYNLPTQKVLIIVSTTLLVAIIAITMMLNIPNL